MNSSMGMAASVWILTLPREASSAEARAMVTLIVVLLKSSIGVLQAGTRSVGQSCAGGLAVRLLALPSSMPIGWWLTSVQFGYLALRLSDRWLWWAAIGLVWWPAWRSKMRPAARRKWLLTWLSLVRNWRPDAGCHRQRGPGLARAAPVCRNSHSCAGCILEDVRRQHGIVPARSGWCSSRQVVINKLCDSVLYVQYRFDHRWMVS
jgi:hypothetical protein